MLDILKEEDETLEYLKNVIRPLSLEPTSTNKYDILLHEFKDKYQLNDHQFQYHNIICIDSRILSRLSESMEANCMAINLIHGVFGSGKSFSIALMVLFVDEAISRGIFEPEDDYRIVLTSFTNRMASLTYIF
jgi:hypothetical protein